MRNSILLSALLLLAGAATAQDKTAYIELYKNVAMSEMMRTGIPASIKLAQGILESNCGKSELACKANNHFGIKCGNDWRGKTFKKEDDDYENGKLTKSCFREFPSVYDSYIAHSDFLTDPKKSARYGFLFELDATDYKAWAKGLSKAGYATDPQYANRLIDIIEKNQLYIYDTPLPQQYAESGKNHKKEKRAPYAQVSSVRYHNDVKYVVASAGDTPESIAAKNDVSSRQVVRYNDNINSENQSLAAGSKVYLQPKRSQNHGRQKYHLLKPGEDLVTISQEYGIKLDALLKRNGLRKGEIPAPNQKIWLKGKSDKKLKTINPFAPPAVIPEPDIKEVVSNGQPSTSVSDLVIPPKNMTTEIASAPIAKAQNSGVAHMVVKGDTLYSIARQYGVTVAELKILNNLSADTIQIGQKLILR